MDAGLLRVECSKAAKEGKYLYVAHNGRFRNVIPYKVTSEHFFCYCTLHPERDVEKWVLRDTDDAQVSDDEIVFYPPYQGDFLF